MFSALPQQCKADMSRTRNSEVSFLALSLYTSDALNSV